MKTLQTTGEVIDALGGTAKVSRRFERSMTVISNWKTGGTFPANTYLAFQAALHAIDCAAPAMLWGMAQVPAASDATGAAA